MKFKKPQIKLKSLKSINYVLMKYFILLASLLILLVEVIFFMVVSSSLESHARNRLTGIGGEVATFMTANDDFAVSGYLRRYRQEGINVVVLSQGGEVLLPFDDSLNENYADEISYIKEQFKDFGGSSLLYSKNNSLNYVSVIDYHGGSYLFANYSLKIINGTRNILLVYFILVGIFVLLAAALFSYSVSQRLSSGIKNLSSTAERFSKGDFNVNFTNSEYKELAVLSDTLNSVRDEVKKSDSFQRELLANVSHDLKTPLTMIKAYASMIREISGDNPQKRDKHLQVIIDEADRLTGLVNDVLNVSKLTSGINEINCKVFNFTEFLYGIINKFEYLQETQGYKIMVDVDANLYTRADEEKIGQVIYNLLGNAVNYTGEDKTVFISLKSSLDGDRIKLKIRDTGKGIAKEDLPEIWNRYYRSRETHSRPVKGTGLGLNIVKIILQNHSFDFGVESELGNGSTFWVDFPSVPAEIDVE